jgi:hypothetical protein
LESGVGKALSYLPVLPVLPFMLCSLLGANLGAGWAGHVVLCLFEGAFGNFWVNRGLFLSVFKPLKRRHAPVKKATLPLKIFYVFFRGLREVRLT